MDKNTIIGFLLIMLILFGFSYLNRPSQEAIEQKRIQDSIALANRQLEAETAITEAIAVDSANSQIVEPDSSAIRQGLTAKYGAFAGAAQGSEEIVTLENDLLNLKISTKGGKIVSALLKKHTNYLNEPLYLFKEGESDFSATLLTSNNLVINTNTLFFTVTKQTDKSVTMSLKTGANSSLDFVYSLHPDDYIVDYKIVPNNLQGIISQGNGTMDLTWNQKVRQNERGRSYEERYARLTYKYLTDDVKEMSPNKEDRKDPESKLKWIAYKDQYFSSVLISKNGFEATQFVSIPLKNSEFLKDYTTLTRIEFNPNEANPVEMNYYFGPNDYHQLKNYDKTKFAGQDLQLEKLVPLGWSLFRFINKWFIIPIFDWLTHNISNIGLAILLLTLIVKTIIFPLTYKSIMSSTKMQVMKPQIEAITAKYPGQENAMQRQQKTMELYNQVGINPMSGCLPMLLQMPILLSLLMFFPSAIELRHQSFLWADDLSTYDALIHWNFNIPILSSILGGNHLSLFCLLMTITQVIYSKFSMDQTSAGQEQMPGMKLMIYVMPVMMLFFLNSYPAGLNYYYFISALVSILQTLGLRWFIDEKKLLAKLEENKKKPAKKKSGFMARLEAAQKQQQAMLREQQKKNGKRR
ncbi:MAG: membrane protein insertase YidC [Dysgonamonadaceae bacterium]|jgi:YidC/Oxa1 family membrane protein insertase|nr:membrane protein insertase YidC [Dysgonamonadaceae bacterium]